MNEPNPRHQILSPPWSLPSEPGRVIRTVEAHAAGEPLRIIVDGLGEIPGSTILEKRAWAQVELDALRRALILEPRGHRDMYGAIPTEPVTSDGHMGVLFLHNEGFSTMCGHGVIALSAALRRLGALPPELSEFRLDTPAGRVVATFPDASGPGPQRVRFRNVASFVKVLDAEVEVPELGRVLYDLAFGGAFYAFVDAEPLGISLDASQASNLSRLGTQIKTALTAQWQESGGGPQHPHAPELSFLYGVIFVGAAGSPEHHSRNVCVFGDGEVDRSPTGTGVSARAAIHHARGELAPGRALTVESILGTTFSVSVEGEGRVGDYAAVIPLVEGVGHLTGRSEFFLDPADPLLEGVLLT